MKQTLGVFQMQIFISVLSIFFLFSSCLNPQDSSTTGGGLITGSPSLAPSSVSISSDTSLVYTSTISGTGLVPMGTGSVGAGSGTAPAAGGLIGAGAGTYVSGGIAPTNSGILVNGSGYSGTDSTNSFTANISVNAVFPTGADASCLVLSPFNAVNCSVSGFSFHSSDIVSNGSLQIKAFAANGSSSDSLLSNSLSVLKYTLRQISNTANNTSITDLPGNFIVYNDSLFFSANNSNGFNKLFKYKESTNSISQISNTRNNNSANDTPTYPYLYNSKLFFFSFNTNGVSKLFRYDDSAETLSQITNTENNNSAGDVPTYQSYKILGGKLYFPALNSFGQPKLYAYDDGASSLLQISNTQNNNANGEWPGYVTAYNNKLFFGALTNWQNKLYSYDPVGGTITKISNTRNSAVAPDDVQNLVVHNNKLFFFGRNANGKFKLYKYDDGTSTLTEVANTTNNTNTDDVISFQQDPIVYNNKLFYFGCNNNGSFIKLYSYDDATGTLTQITNTANNNSLTDNISITPIIYNNKLFFSANNSNAVTKLYSYDDQTQTLSQVSNTHNNNSASDDPLYLTVYNGKLYFSAKNPDGVEKLYYFDDATSSLVQVSNTSGNSAIADSPGGNGGALIVYNNALYFDALNSNGVAKLYRVCDLSAGCTP